MVRRRANRLGEDFRLPIGRVAETRRLLRRLLRAQAAGRVLVVGRVPPVRQAMPGSLLDIAGTDPTSNNVTVCSRVDARGTLPPARWDTVIVNDPDLRLWPRQLDAIL